MKIVNFNVNLNSGMALCALIESLKPGACSQYASLSSTIKVENCRLGMDLAKEYFKGAMHCYEATQYLVLHEIIYA